MFPFPKQNGSSSSLQNVIDDVAVVNDEQQMAMHLYQNLHHHHQQPQFLPSANNSCSYSPNYDCFGERHLSQYSTIPNFLLDDFQHHPSSVMDGGGNVLFPHHQLHYTAHQNQLPAKVSNIYPSPSLSPPTQGHRTSQSSCTSEKLSPQSSTTHQVRKERSRKAAKNRRGRENTEVNPLPHLEFFFPTLHYSNNQVRSFGSITSIRTRNCSTT